MGLINRQPTLDSGMVNPLGDFDTLRDSLMVECWALNSVVLVRIQLPDFAPVMFNG